MRALLAVLVMVLVMVLSTGCEVARPDGELDAGSRSDPDSGVRCVTLPSIIEFGEVEFGQRRTMTLRLTNPVPLLTTVAFGDVSPPFFTTLSGLDGGLVFSPRASRDVDFVFVPPDGRLHLAHFQFNGGAGCATQDVTLSGLGAGRLEANEQLRFPAVDAGTSITLPLRVVNSRREPSDVTTFIESFSRGGHFVVPDAFHLEASSSIDLPITFTADGFEGANVATLLLRTDHGDRLAVSLQAMNGVPVIELSSLRIESEQLALTDSAPRLVFVRNVGRGELFFEEISTSATPPGTASEVTVRANTGLLGPGQIGSLTFVFQPLSVGHRDWEAHLTTNDPLNPRVTISVAAEVSRFIDCDEPLRTPMDVTTGPPYPRLVEIPFQNVSNATCIAESARLSAFSGWSLDLGALDTFAVPPMSTVNRVVTVTGPGQYVLEFSTYSSSSGRTAITAAP